VGDAARSWEAIDAWTEAAIAAAPPEETQRDAIQAEAFVIRTVAASVREDFVRTLELSTEALEFLPAASPWRIWMMMFYGESCLMAGDAKSAEHQLQQVAALTANNRTSDFWMVVNTHLANANVALGQLQVGADLYEQVIHHVTTQTRPFRRSIQAYGGMATVCYERNQLDDALRYARRGLELLDQVGGSLRSVIVNSLPLARALAATGELAEATAVLSRLEGLAAKENVHPFTCALIAAQQARVALAADDLPLATQLLAATHVDFSEPATPSPPSILCEAVAITAARIRLHNGEPAQSLSLLEPLANAAKTAERLGNLLEVTLVQAMAHAALDDSSQALALLTDALNVAEPAGYLRSFVDEGAALQNLLLRWHAHADQPIAAKIKQYGERILAAFPAAVEPGSQRTTTTPSVKQALVEPLSERELEVLQLVAQGLSNSQIADQLIVTVGTVKRHLNNIFGKLGVGSRTQALVRGRELQLL